MPFILKPTITQTFLERVKITPERVAFMHKVDSHWRELSFRDFYNDCRQVSLGLMALGVKPSDKVAVLSGTRYEWSLADMAILGASAISVPIYPSNTVDEVGYILEHSESKVVFTESVVLLHKVLESKHPKLEKIILIDPAGGMKVPENVLTLKALKDLGESEVHLDNGRFEKNLESARPSDLLAICYTSGTTGVPKGAMLTHDNMMSVLEDCEQVYRPHLTENEVILSFMPFSHILGKVESMAIYVFGWREAFAESLDKLMTNLAEIRPTIVFAVPRLFEKAYLRIVDTVERKGGISKKLFDWGFSAGHKYFGKAPSARDQLEYQLARKLVFRRVAQGFGGRLKFALCGGAPLPREIGEFFQVVGVKALEGYGLTETCAPVALNTPDNPRYGTVGRPLPEVAVKIAEDGEILIKSRKVFAGYYKSPEETAQAIRDGWFHTGDIGYIDSDGFLHITDRKKDIIITSAGKNIAPQKIENLAKGYRFINQLVVHGDKRNYLTALVTLNSDEAIRHATENKILFSGFSELVRHGKILSFVQKIIDEINQHLASYETIKKFVILPTEFTVESGELTPSLKVRRRIVEERYRAELDSMYS